MILTVEGAFSILGGVSSHYRDELDKEWLIVCYPSNWTFTTNNLSDVMVQIML